MHYTIRIPYAENESGYPPTPWHPTDRTGPFSSLLRGDFSMVQDAYRWARENLAGYPYSIKET